MRKDYHYSKRLMPLVASLLIMIMFSATVSGYYSHDTKTVTEWQKITMTPATVQSVFVVPEQMAVVYLVNVNMTSKGVKPEIVARCNSPGSTDIIS